MATTVEPETTTGAQTTPGTAVAPAKKEKEAIALPPDVQHQLQLARMKAAVAAAIKGTIWGKDLSDIAIRAVSEYARENHLDAVRHIEVLGGKIYLTAELYEERGVPLMLAGIVRKDEPDYINADARLETMAKSNDSWALEESTRRLRARITRNVPENAAAAVEQRLWVRGPDGEYFLIVGVNWCGGGSRKSDPVGESEPTKTAATRAARRAWKQIVEVIPSYGSQFTSLVEGMSSVNKMLDEHTKSLALAAEKEKPKAIAASSGYGAEVEVRTPVTELVSTPDADDPF